MGQPGERDPCLSPTRRPRGTQQYPRYATRRQDGGALPIVAAATESSTTHEEPSPATLHAATRHPWSCRQCMPPRRPQAISAAPPMPPARVLTNIERGKIGAPPPPTATEIHQSTRSSGDEAGKGQGGVLGLEAQSLLCWLLLQDKLTKHNGSSSEENIHSIFPDYSCIIHHV